MQLRTPAACLGIFGFVLAGCSPMGDDGASAREIADQVTASWLAAYNAGDVEALTDLYDDDAVLHMPGATSVSGKRAIREYWSDDIGGGAQTRIDVHNAYSGGDIVYVEGDYRVLDKGGMQLAAGDFVQLWQRENGVWRIANENWHSHGVSFSSLTGNSLAEMLTSEWTAAYDSGDGSRLAALYAEDAMLTMPGEMTLAGRDEIEGFWIDDIGEDGTRTELVLRDAYVDGDLAHLEGSYRVMRNDGTELVHGEYLQLWVRENDQWRIHREMWSSTTL